MKKYFFIKSMTIIILMILGGCSTSDDYRCESNDLCSSTTEWKYYSCSNDTGHCEKVDPLLLDRSTLPDAEIGQSDYRVELSAAGGIAPYTFSLTREDEEKLKWLTLTPEGENKAILHNSTDTNSVSLVSTDMNNGIPLTVTITLLDSSKHGVKVREDNQGEAFNMTITIKDCPHTCKRFDGDDANENETECTIDAQCSCAKQYICGSYFLATPNACVKWDSGTICDSNVCNKIGTECCGNLCAPSEYPKCTPSQDVDGQATFSNCGYDLTKNDGCFYKAESLCDGNICKEQQCGECSDLSNVCDQQGATRCADNTNQQICIKQGSCLVWSSPLPCESNKICIDKICSCPGCWDGSMCQPGTDTKKCGSGGKNCSDCSVGCLLPGCDGTRCGCQGGGGGG